MHNRWGRRVQIVAERMEEEAGWGVLGSIHWRDGSGNWAEEDIVRSLAGAAVDSRTAEGEAVDTRIRAVGKAGVPERDNRYTLAEMGSNCPGTAGVAVRRNGQRCNLDIPTLQGGAEGRCH